MLGKGKSDPYAIVTVGAQTFRTQTIDNTVNPKWDYWCEVSGLYCIMVVLLNFTGEVLCEVFRFFYFIICTFIEVFLAESGSSMMEMIENRRVV